MKASGLVFVQICRHEIDDFEPWKAHNVWPHYAVPNEWNEVE